MAKTPPNRSYRVFSDVVCAACAIGLSGNTATGTAITASPATTLRLVSKVKIDFSMISFLCFEGTTSQRASGKKVPEGPARFPTKKSAFPSWVSNVRTIIRYASGTFSLQQYNDAALHVGMKSTIVGNCAVQRRDVFRRFPWRN